MLARLKRVDICIVSYENVSASEAVLLRYPCTDDDSTAAAAAAAAAATADRHAGSRDTVYLLYSGQHYDAIAGAAFVSSTWK